MAEAIRTGGEVPVDPRDALLGLRIIETARESAASGRRLAIAA
jgi:predicted dehydrogenase